jgi:hypothetical protein
MLQARKLGADDYYLIRGILKALIRKLQASGRKAIYKHLDLEKSMAELFQFDHAYVVEESYLVVYELGIPWYSSSLFLSEQLVLQLSSKSDFSVVTRFLEQAGREAGAALAEAGTALAKHDAALASLYEEAGFIKAAFALTKEL